jgi:hypothetical protein
MIWYGKSRKTTSSPAQFRVLTYCTTPSQWYYCYNNPENIGELVTWIENLCCDASEVKEER